MVAAVAVIDDDEAAPPKWVDAEKLARLCLDVPANAEAVKIMLWGLAGVVAKTIKGMPRGDAKQAIYEDMLKAIPRYVPGRGKPFTYFWLVGTRAGWRAAERWQKVPEAADVTAVEVKGRTTIKGAEPLRYGRRLTPPALTPMEHLDHVIRKTRDSIRRYSPEEAEYRHLLSGLEFLQELRHRITGAYLPMKTPALRYTGERMIRTTT